jgi:isocitrate/isopropylmalate dehydrogenase
VLAEGKVRTADIGGSASTEEMANAIVAKLKAA